MFKQIIPQSWKNFYHLLQAMLANFIYGFPSQHLIVIGVTGTNGKTTVVNLIAKILEEAGYKVGAASTIHFQIGEKKWVNRSKMTTFGSFALQKLLNKMVRAGCDYAVIETSSHALDQNRVWGINYDIAVLTNITREHLDYHKTMEAYQAAKAKLFKNLTKGKRKEKEHIIPKTAILNSDDESFRDFLKYPADEKIAYGIKFPAPDHQFSLISAGNFNFTPHGSDFSVIAKGGSFSVHLDLPGKFNVYNALAAIATGLTLKIDHHVIKSALEKIKGIPGRMEEVDEGQNFAVLIDYAVTPDSLEQLYQTVKTFDVNKIIAVFGACGERDRGKRPIMGEIVGKHADYIVLTNEDPYNEDSKCIVSEIEPGVERAGKVEGKDFWTIMDRREALKFALKKARPGDIVVATGKGAEETMAIGKERIPWNEKKVITELLHELGLAGKKASNY